MKVNCFRHLFPELNLNLLDCYLRHYTVYSLKDLIGIPTGYKYQIIENQHAEVKLFRYLDSCFIFVSNSHTDGKIFEDIARVYGKTPTSYLSSDTMTLFGRDKKGHYWEQKKYKSFLVGYFRVPFNKLDYYHKIISNVNIKKLPLLE